MEWFYCANECRSKDQWDHYIGMHCNNTDYHSSLYSPTLVDTVSCVLRVSGRDNECADLTAICSPIP